MGHSDPHYVTVGWCMHAMTSEIAATLSRAHIPQKPQRQGLCRACLCHQPTLLQALELLNVLMFAPDDSPAVPADGPDCNSSSTSSSSASQSWWSAVWPRNNDLLGPDLSGFKVPRGSSGLGLKVGVFCFMALSWLGQHSPLAATLGECGAKILQTLVVFSPCESAVVLL